MMIYAHIDSIHDNPYQQRQVYGDIGELALDIRRHKAARPDSLGLQQVPTARVIFRTAAEPNGRLLSPAEVKSWSTANHLAQDTAVRVELEFGHRRLRAFRHLAAGGYDAYSWMPLNILALDDAQMLDGVWSENEARRNLSDVERAELIRVKLDTGLTQQQVAEEWGLSRSQVSWLLGLLTLSDEVKAANRTGQLAARTAYALRDVERLVTAVNGSSWQKLGAGKYLSQPTAPDAFLTRVLNKPEKVTSDDVRDYIGRAVAWSGSPLPDAVAKFGAKMGKDIVQMGGCKGCTYRVNSSCLKRACRQAKQAQLSEATLTAVAAELAIPISRNLDDFLPAANEWSTRRQIAEAWEKGIEADWVIGWLDHKRNGVRPFLTDGYISREADLFAVNGRAGIVIAPRGGYLSESDLTDLAALDAAEKGEDPDAAIAAADIAGPAQQKAWETQAADIIKAMHRQATEAMTDALYMPVSDAADIIQALMADPDKEWIDDHEQFLKAFIHFLWNKGRGGPGVGSYHKPLDSCRNINVLLRRAGLQPIALQQEETAVLVLNYWYGIRSFEYSFDDRWPDAITELEQLLADWPGSGSGDTVTLRYELGRALTDARSKLAERLARDAARAAHRAQLEAEQEAIHA